MQLRWTDGGSSPQRARCPGCFSEKDLTTVCPHCGFDEAQDNPVGTLPSLTSLQEGRYKTGRVLGQSDWFGVTYLGLDEKNQLRVALREYFPSDRAALRAQVSPSADGQEDAFMKGLQAFRDQAEFLSRFQHAHVQPVRGCFLDNGLAYRVSDFPGGIRLSSYLEQSGGRLAPQDALAVLKPVLEGLNEIHEAGFVHGGFDPAKIRLIRKEDGDSPRHPLLIGFAAERSAYIESGQAFAQPTAYDAPELAQGRPTDRLSEVYAASAVLYRMVTGEPPATAQDRLQQASASADPLVRPSRLWSDIPGHLEEALLKGLALERQERPQNLLELLELARQPGGDASSPSPLDEVAQPVQPVSDSPPLEAQPTAAASPEIVSYPPPPAPRQPRRISAGFLALALVGLVGVLALVVSIGIPMQSSSEGSDQPGFRGSGSPGPRRPELDQPLLSAVRQDSSEQVRALIGQGADPDARDPSGTPVLVIAARRGRPDIVQNLLEAGAQVNARGTHGETALRSAVLINSIEAVRLLAGKGVDDRAEALKMAQELGRPEIVQLLKESAP